jgi:hypothetical protein
LREVGVLLLGMVALNAHPYFKVVLRNHTTELAIELVLQACAQKRKSRQTFIQVVCVLNLCLIERTGHQSGLTFPHQHPPRLKRMLCKPISIVQHFYVVLVTNTG